MRLNFGANDVMPQACPAFDVMWMGSVITQNFLKVKERNF